MPRDTHCFASDEKLGARRRTLAFYLKAAKLLAGGMFTPAIVETAGTTFQYFFNELQPHLGFDGQHVAVENDFATFVRGGFKLTTPIKLIYGDVFHVARRMAEDVTPGAAIFNFDMTSEVGQPRWWNDHGAIIEDTLRVAVKRYGCSVFVLNQTMDKPFPTRTASERLREQSHQLCQRLRGYGLISDRLLGRKGVLAGQADDRTYEGNVGAYDVYRGSDRALRMAMLRLRFEPGRAVIDGEPQQ